MIITSTQNQQYKQIRALKNKKAREESHCFIAEGVNLIKDIPCDVKVCGLYLRESEYENLKQLETVCRQEAVLVKDVLFDGLCDTVTPAGAIAVVEQKTAEKVSGDTVLLLCGMSDAGNVGTVLRTAAAKNVHTVLLYGACADAYSPKVVRASMGGIFTVNIVEVKLDDIVELKKNYSLLTLDMNGGSVYDYKRKGKIILTVGNEAHGIPAEIRELADEVLSLPMEGRMESLNAAVSASIALYLI